MIKYRYRLGKEGRLFRTPVLVLQILEQHDDGPSDENGLPQFLAGERWRDATVEDLQVKE
jgi:hypothetical protein